MFDFLGPDSTGHYLQPAVHGAGDGNGGGFLVLIDSALDAVSRALESGDSGNPLVGVEALGTNWHPLIVHFPIAFLTGFFLLELIGVVLRRQGLRYAASWMLYLGALAAIAAATAGLIAANTVPHGSGVHEIMEWHERLGLTIAGLSSVLAIWRLLGRERISAMAEALHLFLGAILVIAIVFAADLGGLMVYQHGVGVKSLQVADDHHHHHHHDDHEHAQADSNRASDAQPTQGAEAADNSGESDGSSVEPRSHGASDSADEAHSHEASGSEAKPHSHETPSGDGKTHSHKDSHTHGKPHSHGVAGTRKEPRAKP
ncbi:DUF2231 domain-containing protein [Methylocaldum szegediense]|uniref:Membrane protein n=1 Tax=Methylocaldum szegediense TaxID=73780 RepID=A0ABM9HYL1_9GAMM|nr:DUF2231 domain-containing protein [Methylocaldum szegediense]CAI8764905.1 putative membrane protein [Methylocaldum szegediense]